MTIARFRGRCSHCGHDHDADEAAFQAALKAPPEERRRLTVMPIVKTLKDQRDQVATVLRELLRLYDWRNELGRIERDFNHDKKQMTTWLNTYGREKHAAWDAARAILAKCPSYEQQLRNVAEGLGMTYEELIEGVKRLDMNSDGLKE